MSDSQINDAFTTSAEQARTSGFNGEHFWKALDPVYRPFVRFLHVEAAGGFALLLSSLVALIIANSAFSEAYAAFWQINFRIGLESFELSYPLWYWVNDGLMVIFFFLVGLEIKRELALGEFRDVRKVTLPIAAAIGGAIGPPLIYVLLAPPDAVSGWAVPMATDIAFVVSIMVLLGNRVPQGLKLFVLTVAIADDIIGIAVIAIFFTAELNGVWLLLAAGGLVLTWMLNRLGVRTIAVYVFLGAGIWLGTLKGGIHPTVTGAALGLLTPANAWLGEKSLLEVLEDIGRSISARVSAAGTQRSHAIITQMTTVTRDSFSPLERLELSLQPWVAFLIMPVFALANAAVPISWDGLAQSLSVAIAAAMVFGKPLGILVVSAVVVRLGFGQLPQGVSWMMLAGAASLAGIGFTMALFIAGLAFEEDHLIAAKSGVLLGSLVSGTLGILIMRLATRRSCFTSIR